MFNLGKFISENVTFRPKSMFLADIEANKEQLTKEIEGKSLCVIGGAGSIGSSFIRAILPFKPSKLVVVDLNENGLARSWWSAWPWRPKPVIARRVDFNNQHNGTDGTDIMLAQQKSYPNL